MNGHLLNGAQYRRLAYCTRTSGMKGNARYCLDAIGYTTNVALKERFPGFSEEIRGFHR